MYSVEEEAIRENAGHRIRCLQQWLTLNWVVEEGSALQKAIQAELEVQKDRVQFPSRHKCVQSGCEDMVQFDDEPRCYRHSPDSGSDVCGYSYRAMRLAQQVEVERTMLSAPLLGNELEDFIEF